MAVVEQEVAQSSNGEVRRTLKDDMWEDPEDTPVEVWRCLGERPFEFLTRTIKGR